MGHMTMGPVHLYGFHMQSAPVNVLGCGCASCAPFEAWVQLLSGLLPDSSFL